MSLMEFLGGIVEGAKDFIEVLLVDIIECIACLISVRVIIFVTDFLFTEENFIIYFIEMASHIGIVAIFATTIIYDFMKIWEKKRKI